MSTALLEEPEQLTEYIPGGDPTAGGNDTVFLALGKTKAAEAGLIPNQQKPSPAAIAKAKAEQANQNDPSRDGADQEDLIPSMDIEELLGWLAQESLELTAADHEYTEGLPESIKSARSRRQVQIAIQSLMMMQIQAYFQMQMRPQSFTPQQLIATQRLIAQLMQISKAPEFRPEMLRNLNISRDTALLQAVVQMRQQLQQLGAVPNPLRPNAMILDLAQKMAAQSNPALDKILQNIAGVKGAESLTAEGQKLRQQLLLLQKMDPNKNPAQTLMAILSHLKQNNQPLPLPPQQIKALIANINTPAGRQQVTQLTAQLSRQTMQNLARFQQRAAIESPRLPLQPAARQTLIESSQRLSGALRATLPPVLLQQINAQLRIASQQPVQSPQQTTTAPTNAPQAKAPLRAQNSRITNPVQRPANNAKSDKVVELKGRAPQRTGLRNNLQSNRTAQPTPQSPVRNNLQSLPNLRNDSTRAPVRHTATNPGRATNSFPARISNFFGRAATASANIATPVARSATSNPDANLVTLNQSAESRQGNDTPRAQAAAQQSKIQSGFVQTLTSLFPSQAIKTSTTQTDTQKSQQQTQTRRPLRRRRIMPSPQKQEADHKLHTPATPAQPQTQPLQPPTLELRVNPTTPERLPTESKPSLTPERIDPVRDSKPEAKTDRPEPDKREPEARREDPKQEALPQETRREEIRIEQPQILNTDQQRAIQENKNGGPVIFKDEKGRETVVEVIKNVDQTAAMDMMAMMESDSANNSASVAIPTPSAATIAQRASVMESALGGFTGRNTNGRPTEGENADPSAKPTEEATACPVVGTSGSGGSKPSHDAIEEENRRRVMEAQRSRN